LLGRAADSVPVLPWPDKSPYRRSRPDLVPLEMAIAASCKRRFTGQQERARRGARMAITDSTVGFVQVIEVVTTRVAEIEELLAGWRDATEGSRRATRGTLCADRDRPDTYVQLVEFPSYADAMANSELPATADFAERLAKLCDQPPSFRNLDVHLMEQF